MEQTAPCDSPSYKTKSGRGRENQEKQSERMKERSQKWEGLSGGEETRWKDRV